MDVKELRGMTKEALLEVLQQNRSEIVNLRFQKELQQLDNPSRIRLVRRDIARIITILKEKNDQGTQETKDKK
ncbi:50S ribosomal protein L29 [bacterium]|nr:50S ribosomal protein L29 [bacterium]MBL7052411.1 50S ribosomal protein L29 [Candidatus Neomarinimicrobiota bacterium]